MQTYIVRIRCLSPFLTPWRSSTLWGRLAWIIADGRLNGWTIQDWIELYDAGVPPLVLGDALPQDKVPVPGALLAQASGPSKKPSTLAWHEWTALCKTGVWPDNPTIARSGRYDQTHVVMSRETGSALEGGLRTESGELPPAGLFVLADVDDLVGKSGLEQLFGELAHEGWGQGRTAGYGHFEIESIEQIMRPPNTGWSVTLGHCHPTNELPQQGFWRWAGVPVRPHSSTNRKGAEEFFTTMLVPGACFPTDSAAPLGQIIGKEGVQNYNHYGMAPTWPFTYPVS